MRAGDLAVQGPGTILQRSERSDQRDVGSPTTLLDDNRGVHGDFPVCGEIRAQIGRDHRKTLSHTVHVGDQIAQIHLGLDLRLTGDGRHKFDGGLPAG